jgi:hypothetical protein
MELPDWKPSVNHLPIWWKQTQQEFDRRRIEMRDIRLEAQGESARDKIIPFPDAATRPVRPPAADERKGVILLFTGVRYERSDMDNVPTPPVASDGSRRRRS